MHANSLFLLPILALVASLPAQTTKPAKPLPMSARHILVPWKGARAAPPEITRSKEEARKEAERILALLKEGKDFAELASTSSSCPSKVVGGQLGQFRKGEMHPLFEKAVVRAEPGEVVGPVETDFGFHLIERLAVTNPWPEQIAVSHILIAFKGAMQAAPTVTRSEDEARRLAEQCVAELKTGKKKFEDLAKAHSDDKGSGAAGGKLGVQSPRAFVPAFSDATVALAVGAVSKAVRTPFGFHIIRRERVPVPMRASHILIPWKGASNAPANTTRSKEEALAFAKELLTKLGKGDDFSKLAKTNSTCPSGLQAGGDLGPFRPGQMVKPFEDAVKGAKIGEVVGPIETQFGWHIIKRTK